MSCVLRIAGENLDVEAVVRQLGFAPYRTWLKGQPMSPKSLKSKIHINNGAVFDVSSADMAEFDKQLMDATAFLVKHKKALKTITSLPEAEFVTLDFAIQLRATVTHSDVLPASFLKSAAAVGISVELSHYTSWGAE